MQKKKKAFQKSILSLLIMALLVTSIPVLAFADEAEPERETLIKQVEAKADELIAMDELSSRARLTNFENNTDLDETPWYTVWEEAKRLKDKARFCSIEELKNALNSMAYNQKLYAFPVTHDLKKDGFYTGAFEIYNLTKIGGGHNQDLFAKGDVNNDVKDLFDKKIRIIKTGNQFDIRLDADRKKVKSIEAVVMNHIMTKGVYPEYQNAENPDQSGPTTRTAFTVTVPEELNGEELAVTSLKYVDSNGVERKIGPFGIFINYSALTRDETYITPNYSNDLRERAKQLQINLKPLVEGDEDEKYINEEQKKVIRDVLSGLEKFTALQDKDLTYAQYLDIANRGMDIENAIVLKKALEKKLNFGISDTESNIYNKDEYDAGSVKALGEYYKKSKANLPNLSLKDVVLETTAYKYATSFYLRHNMSTLEATIKEAKEKVKEGNSFTMDTYGKLLTALANAEEWVKKNKEYYYPEDSKESTKTYDTALRDAINKLKKATPEEPKAKEYTVNVRFLDNNNPEKESRANVCLSDKARLTVKKADSKLMLNLKPMYMNGAAAGAISKVYTYKGAEKLAGKILENGSIEINGKSFEYPTMIEIPVDGTTKKFKVNLDINAPGQGLHQHDVILEVDYDHKSEGYKPNQGDDVDKAALIKAINFYSSKPWKESVSIIKPKNLEKLNSLLEKAMQVRENQKATQNQVNDALNKLTAEGERVNNIVVLYRSCEQAAGDYRSDLASKKFSAKSMEAIKALIVEGQGILAKDDISDIDIQRLVEIDFTNLYKMHRYDTSGIQAAVDKANAKLSNGSSYASSGVEALKKAIKDAEAYIEKASQTSNIADERDKHIKNVNEKTSMLKAVGEEPEQYEQTRVFGSDRYETSMRIADKLKEKMNVEKFDSIVVACGENYADALSGSYLAKVKNAPVILADNSTIKSNTSYIEKNLKDDGTVYILGGTTVIPKALENNLKKYKVKRISGEDRFETNLAILKEAKIENEELIICSGLSFADALSAGAAGRPIMIVDNGLNAEQTALLKSLKSDKLYVIGGVSAVNARTKSDIDKIRKSTRIAGEDRFKTSVAIANEFFKNKPSNVVLANGENFPDGIAGGVLAIQIDAPILLVAEGDYTKDAMDFYKKSNSKGYIALGGEKSISSAALSAIVG